MMFISVDVEASGPVPSLYNLVSIGAVPVRGEPGGPFEIVEGASFYVELKPAFPGFVEEAMAVHGIPRSHLEKEGKEPVDAMGAFRDWVLEQAKGEEKPAVFVGHNAAFDWSYVNFYFHYTKVENPFDIFSLDTKSLACGRFDMPWHKARKSVFQKMFDAVPALDEVQRHRADYDAEYQAVMLRELMNTKPGSVPLPGAD
ncbi:MAG: 3'-5' exonuclease [Planctomycetota bacterium]|jgi:DNA polymerase III epsilon subunit-like protein